MVLLIKNNVARYKRQVYTWMDPFTTINIFSLKKIKLPMDIYSIVNVLLPTDLTDGSNN